MNAAANPSRYWEVSERDGADERKDIYFKVLKSGCPTEQQQLKDDVERVLSTLRIIYPDARDGKYDEAFAKLLALAQTGLAGEDPATSVAKSALRSLREEIVDREAGRIKNQYMIMLGKWACVMSVVTLLFYAIISGYPKTFEGMIYSNRNFGNYLVDVPRTNAYIPLRHRGTRQWSISQSPSFTTTMRLGSIWKPSYGLTVLSVRVAV